MSVNGTHPSDGMTIPKFVVEQERDAIREALGETQHAIQQLDQQQQQLAQQRAQATEVFLRQQGALQVLENLLLTLQPATGE